jgi:hypothetical protein
MSDLKRPLDLKQFANSLPPGTVNQDPVLGRFVFGSRAVDNLPYLVRPGAAAEIKPDEVLNTPVVVKAHVFTFDTSKEDDRLKYEQILDAIAAKWYVLMFTSRHWDANTQSMKIYIEVVERHRVIEPSTAYDTILSQMNGNAAVPIT